MPPLISILKPKILPAITFERLEDALPVAETLLNAGLNVMEIPFRTPVAAQAIALIRQKLPEMHIGAGTLMTNDHIFQAIEAGAQFGLSAGFNPSVTLTAKVHNLPFITGVMTPSEVALAFEMGCKIQKVFPIAQIGGVEYLKALSGPYGHLDIQFIPMGGVNLKNMEDYLKLKNVIAVGGSWLVTKELIDRKDYKQMEINVLEALDLVNGY